MVDTVDTVVIERRFCGPDGSGHGGYTCGLVARAVGNPAEVRLRMPPPLDRPLQLVRTDEDGTATAELRDGDDVVATGRHIDHVDLDVPDATVAPDEAEQGAARYLEWAADAHPFPRCFTCGPDRTHGDGLRVFTGELPERSGLYAAPWVPHDSLAADDGSGEVRTEFVWAALDCPTCAPVLPMLKPEQAVVLGTLAAGVQRRPKVGERYVLLAWLAATSERVAHGGCVLLDEQGASLAVSRGTWVYVDRARFGGAAARG